MSDLTPDEKRALKRRMKSAARLYAVQALFQMEAGGQGADRVRQEFEDHRFGMVTEEGQLSEGDVDLFRALIEGAVDAQVRIDRATDAALVDRWPLGRIDPTLRALFRAAGSELLAAETPPKVVITEYVEIARAFFPEGKEGGLVNAVLDQMAKAFDRL
ncbi:transcription antitermination factor NusB [Jannaschia formosa]|uniref:transcription antitermination factor NusB n=1 Tax=Jannaschia formosa TaxID=2259592 RepID=UPI000E1C2A26|nr:transcription antitermination factor NusB [Jannaschia formosa]TFL18755.1 transcription antitermination factor NusB [Jannaschia formosa]